MIKKHKHAKAKNNQKVQLQNKKFNPKQNRSDKVTNSKQDLKPHLSTVRASKKTPPRLRKKELDDEEFETAELSQSDFSNQDSNLSDVNDSDDDDSSHEIMDEERLVNQDGMEDQESDDESDEDEEKKIINSTIKAMNRKGKKSGGFQSMGLSFSIFKAIGQMGYKVPTPIQRKAIPVIMDGRDIVAMARTGSGKTAAFLIPLIEKLKAHSAKVGSRGLILSPSRELAMQTLKFCKDLGKHTDLRYCVLVGGDNMEDQFTAIATNPDIIIATPGRLLHLMVEMSLDLKTMQYVVFDEADRLFEMGFAEQLREILFKLPDSRQTLLFSATMPKSLVEFAKAGLTDPALIRLDVDTKISKDLQLFFFSMKKEQKDAMLVYLLRNMVAEKEQVIIFAATKHHVEYLHELLTNVGIQNTYIYGALDQQARRIHLARFRSEKEKILIVTDVAARGLDIPLLDHVINYDFPAASKVFIHRVGRVARAGRSGKAWSFVMNDEIPYMIDFQLFTSRSLVFASSFAKNVDPDYTRDIVFGNVPESVIHLELEEIIKCLKESVILGTLSNSVENACKMYYRSRPTASKESYKRAKEILANSIGTHPVLEKYISENEAMRTTMLESISKFRPAETVFELGRHGSKAAEAVLMQKRRSQLSLVIDAVKEQRRNDISKSKEEQTVVIEKRKTEQLDDEEGLKSFGTIESTKKKAKISRGSGEYRDGDHYMSYRPADADIEQGYSMNKSDSTFLEKAKSTMFDMIGDDEDALKPKRGALTWDSKKHRFIRPTVGSDNKKMIKSDSGALLPASYKTKRFAEWQQRRKISLPRTGEAELDSALQMIKTSGSATGLRRFKHTKMTAPDPNSKNFARKERRRIKEAQENGEKSSSDLKPTSKKITKHHSKEKKQNRPKNELKTSDQILKERRAKEKRKEKTGRHFLHKAKKRN